MLTGAIGGCVIANLMFSLDAMRWSDKARSSGALWLGESVARIVRFDVPLLQTRKRA